ncbi:MAG: PEP-CTERM sorting domain-containing protein [Sedimentisphaerales bacterium]|nr:PEP-CTERM sorting domain-containing protein [Sedimentisphaerales bacterium]
MKRLLMLCVCAVVSIGQAGVIESFDYDAGVLEGSNGGTGWTGEWRNQYSRNGRNYVVADSGLTHFSLPGEAGNAAYSPGDGTRYQRNLDQTYSSGTVYLSFLLQIATDVDAYGALELQSGKDADPGRVFQIGMLRKDDGSDPLPSNDDDGDHQFAASSRSSIGGSRLDTAVLGAFDPGAHLYVVRFDLDADVASIYFDPTDATDLTTGGLAVALFDGFSFDRVGIANFTGVAGTTVDEIYLDTTAPVLVPEPATMVLLGLGCLLAARKRK